ncbi:unnamed protein product, partial [Oppiella nova]
IYILLIFVNILLYTVNGGSEDEAIVAPEVPECKYPKKDGVATCPNVTTGGAIPKLMQCANKMKHDFMGFCKNPPSEELMDKLREQCVMVCIFPCLPTDIMNVGLGDCDIDVTGMELSMEMFCDKKKQKLGKSCAASLFKKHKNEYMDLFNKKIHMICKLCFSFY